MNTRKRIRKAVFFPPWLLLMAMVAISLVNYDQFLSATSAGVNWIIENFGWIIVLVAVMALLLLVSVFFSPLADVRIGGRNASPILKRSDWMFVTLTTTIGSGILFWATAEPMLHTYNPPANIAAGAGSGEAVIWAMETMFLEWTWLPYALYTVGSLAFAFSFYNMHNGYTLASILSPFFGKKKLEKISPWVDAVCLFTMVCGIASAMGPGVMNIAGGLESAFGIPSNSFTWLLIIVAVVVGFLATSISGIQKGIAKLADLNVKFYFVLMAFLFLLGPTAYVLNLTVESYGSFISDFFRIALNTSTVYDDGWARIWPIYYFCVWAAWTPTTALFLGRISRGYTVREMLVVNLIIPAIFSSIWLGLFSSLAVYFETHGAGIWATMQTAGVESAIYTILKQFPLSMIVIPVYVLVVYISFVTATNSNTTAMSGLSVTDIDMENPEPPSYMKTIWAVTIGAVTYIMIAGAGIDGIKMVGNLGGLPACLVLLIACISVVMISRNPAAYDIHPEDYDENGRALRSKEQPWEGSESGEAERKPVLARLLYRIRE